MNLFERDFKELGSQIHNLEPDLSNRRPQTDLAMSTAIASSALYQIQLANLGGTLALFAMMLLSAVCTALLILATRRATLRQIQFSLLALSEQFNALQRSLPSGRPSGD